MATLDLATLLSGLVLTGYCNGYFGSHSYEDKRVEAVGRDWIVARGVSSQTPMLAVFSSQQEMYARLQEWTNMPVDGQP